MIDWLRIDRHKYFILPHFKFIRDKIIFLDKYEFFVADKNIKLNNNEKIEFLLNEGVIIKKIKKKSTRKKCKNRILAIEPHPDDFVLSASGFVLKKNCCAVKILNIFSKTLIKNFPWRDKFSINERELEEMRIKESFIAIEQYLKFNFESLKLPLAQKRGHKSNHYTQKTKSEDDLIETLSERFVDEINKNDYNILLCPMGVQNHIDHIVVFEACMSAYRKIMKQKNKPKFIFYEEYPYSRNREALSDRLRHLSKLFEFRKKLVRVDDNLEIIRDAIMIYRTQFDDINPKQMLDMIIKDFESISNEEIKPKNDNHSLFQRYHELEKIL